MARITVERLPEWARTIAPRGDDGEVLSGPDLADWYFTVEEGRQVGLREVARENAQVIARLDVIAEMVGAVGSRLVDMQRGSTVQRAPQKEPSRPTILGRVDDWDPDWTPPPKPVSEEVDVSSILPPDVDYQPGAKVTAQDDVMVLPSAAVQFVAGFIVDRVPVENRAKAMEAFCRQARGWLPANPAEGLQMRKGEPWRDLPSRGALEVIWKNFERLGLVPPAPPDGFKEAGR